MNGGAGDDGRGGGKGREGKLTTRPAWAPPQGRLVQCAGPGFSNPPNPSHFQHPAPAPAPAHTRHIREHAHIRAHRWKTSMHSARRHAWGTPPPHTRTHYKTNTTGTITWSGWEHPLPHDHPGGFQGVSLASKWGQQLWCRRGGLGTWGPRLHRDLGLLCTTTAQGRRLWAGAQTQPPAPEPASACPPAHGPTTSSQQQCTLVTNLPWEPRGGRGVRVTGLRGTLGDPDRRAGAEGDSGPRALAGDTTPVGEPTPPAPSSISGPAVLGPRAGSVLPPRARSASSTRTSRGGDRPVSAITSPASLAHSRFSSRTSMSSTPG